MNWVLTIAQSCLNIPYKWGGDNPVSGFDCSGLICWILKGVGLMKFHDPKMSAQELNDHFQGKLGPNTKWFFGALCFYGADLQHIEHVGFCISDRLMIEAGGGDHTILLPADAALRSACVRIAPIQRPNLIGGVMPDYSTVGIFPECQPH